MMSTPNLKKVLKQETSLYWFLFFLVVIVYYVAAIIGHAFATPPGVITPMWPASGVAVAAVLRLGYSISPAILVSATIFNFKLMGSPTFLTFLYAIGIGLGELLEAILAVWLLKKFTKIDYAFSRVYYVFLFLVICAFIAPIINAIIGTSIYYLSGNLGSFNNIGFLKDWFSWWIGDVIGVMTVTPFIIAWTQPEPAAPFKWKTLIELVVFLILLALITWFILSDSYPKNYLFMPFAIWAALRFRIRIATLISLLIAIIVIVGTVKGLTEFYVGHSVITLLLVQGFVGVISTIILLLSAGLSERKKAHAELRLINRELEERVQQRTQDLAQKNDALNEAIIELKKTQAQLVQSEKMSSVGMLAAGVAHEINNAVNFISANLEPLKKDVNDISEVLVKYSELDNNDKFKNELKDVIALKSNLDLDYSLKEVKELLAAMDDGSKRTTTIVKDLRTFSRLDESAIKAVNIHENIDSTLTLLHSQFKNRITIVKNYGDIPEVECYPGKLNQVFMNLLMNATQAIKKEGTVEISTEAKGDNVIISIKDSGSGMAPEVMNKIFEPFFTTKDVGQGTGLGLWITYDIVNAHHGKIEVKSTLGVGTEFIITLPIKQEND